MFNFVIGLLMLVALVELIIVISPVVVDAIEYLKDKFGKKNG